MYKIFSLIAVLLLTAGCSKKLKETIGVITPGPNEYKVERNKPLELPPHYELPPLYKSSDNKKLD